MSITKALESYKRHRLGIHFDMIKEQRPVVVNFRKNSREIRKITKELKHRRTKEESKGGKILTVKN